MKMLTKELQKIVPALYTNEEKDPKDIMCHLKYFNPVGHWTWYITEASAVGLDKEGEEIYKALDEFEDTITKFDELYRLIDGEEMAVLDVIMFGWVDGDFPELGYVSLKELMGVRLPFGMSIERDLYWNPKALSEIMQ